MTDLSQTLTELANHKTENLASDLGKGEWPQCQMLIKEKKIGGGKA